MRILIAALIFAVSTLALAVEAPTEKDLRILEHDYRVMESLRLTYSEEIFEYCVKKHGTVASAAAGCMMKQDRYRTEILEEALEQLGRQSLALALYDDCLDYYPMHSVARISQCVRTRLDLQDRLQDDFAERHIYQFCDVKWRKHGHLSVDNCSNAQARYYLRTGDFRN